MAMTPSVGVPGAVWMWEYRVEAFREARSMTDRGSVLQERIAAGVADPISDFEREQAKLLRDFYEEKFGKKPPHDGRGPG